MLAITTFFLMARTLAQLIVRLGQAGTLGAGLSVVTAWCAAAFEVRNTNESLAVVAHGIGGWATESLGVTRLQVLDEDYIIQSAGEAAPLAHAWEIKPAARLSLSARNDQVGPRLRAEVVAAYGWPFRCVWYHARTDEQLSAITPANDDPAVTLERAPGAQAIVVPIRPLWLGMLANVTVFGGMFFVLLSIPGMRRFSRRLHHQCEWCGYPLRGLPGRRCPECGHGPLSQPAFA